MAKMLGLWPWTCAVRNVLPVVVGVPRPTVETMPVSTVSLVSVSLVAGSLGCTSAKVVKPDSRPGLSKASHSRSRSGYVPPKLVSMTANAGADMVEATRAMADAVAVKIAGLNAESFGGHNDWRLPNRNELTTLINFGAQGPAAYANFNTVCDPGCTVTQCNCTGNTIYWTSTASVNSPNYQWYVNFSLGDFAIQQKTEQARVRVVRTIP